MGRETPAGHDNYSAPAVHSAWVRLDRLWGLADHTPQVFQAFPELMNRAQVYMNSIRPIARFVVIFSLSFYGFCLQGVCASAADAVRFMYRPPVVGQHGAHDTQFALNFDISLTQAGQVIS